MNKYNNVPVVSIKNVSFQYEKRTVLDHVSFDIHHGDFVGLVGPNGSGKSTLIKIILGLLKPNDGEVKLFNQSISSFQDWHKIGYVSQKANSFNTGFPSTVFEVVSMGLYGKMGLFKWMGKKEKKKVQDALEMVGMTEYAKQSIGMLSGGQQQRVFIARALVSDPELLILDEPTVGVDVQSNEQFYELLEKMNRELNVSILLVSHDMSVITTKVDRVACLNKKLHFHGAPKEFEKKQEEILSNLYGHDVQILEHNH